MTRNNDSLVFREVTAGGKTLWSTETSLLIDDWYHIKFLVPNSHTACYIDNQENRLICYDLKQNRPEKDGPAAVRGAELLLVAELESGQFLVVMRNENDETCTWQIYDENKILIKQTAS